MATALARRTTGLFFPRMLSVSRSFSSKSEGRGSEKKAPVKPKKMPPVHPDAAVEPPIPNNMTYEEYRSFILREKRTRNAITGGLLMTGVFAIYFYSMYAVNQDPLDDILEEAKPKTQ